MWTCQRSCYGGCARQIAALQKVHTVISAEDRRGTHLAKMPLADDCASQLIPSWKGWPSTCRFLRLLCGTPWLLRFSKHAWRAIRCTLLWRTTCCLQSCSASWVCTCPEQTVMSLQSPRYQQTVSGQRAVHLRARMPTVIHTERPLQNHASNCLRTSCLLH